MATILDITDMNRSWVRFRPHFMGIILLTLATKYIPWVLGSDDRCWRCGPRKCPT